MHEEHGRVARGLVLASIAALAATAGCSYLRNRGSDALDMFDAGVTWTRKPQFGIYANCPFLAPAGYAKVDGHFAGIGGGQLGVVEHRQDNVGLLAWGREDVKWGDDCECESPSVNEVAPAGFVTDAVDKDEAYEYEFKMAR